MAIVLPFSHTNPFAKVPQKTYRFEANPFYNKDSKTTLIWWLITMSRLSFYLVVHFWLPEKFLVLYKEICHGIPSIYFSVSPWTHLNRSYGCLVDSKRFYRSDCQHSSTCSGTSFQEPFTILLNDRWIRETLEHTGTHKGGPFPRNKRSRWHFWGSLFDQKERSRWPRSLLETVL